MFQACSPESTYSVDARGQTRAMWFWIAVLLIGWMGEPGVTRLTPLIVAAFVYQCAVVAFASFLTWFWLLRHYLAARLSVLTFLTPLFGVLAGVLLLGEPLTPFFAVAAVLVGAGIYLVNLKT